MKLKTFLTVGCLGGLFTLSSCTAPTNTKTIVLTSTLSSVPADMVILSPEQ